MTTSNNKENVGEKIFEHKWEIKNWKDVVRNEALAKNTTANINLEADNVVFAKVVVGTSLDQGCVGFYWKLVSKHHCLDDINADLVAAILRNGIVPRTYKVQSDSVIGTEMDIVKHFWTCTASDFGYDTYTNSEGSLEINLTFTLKGLPEMCSFFTEAFQTTSRNEVSQNLASLLNDKSSSDIKLVTNDGNELFAHKLILRARCPVFASMFGSDYLENTVGLVKIDDISSKTMKILLRYWYTGELAESWKDDDTIIEFVYASGKYHLTPILEMLNNIVGLDINPSERDVELLQIVHSLSLKNAEARILKRIKSSVSQAENGTELLKIFYLSTEKLVEIEFSASQILKALDDALGEENEVDASFHDVKLLAHACKQGMKNVENKLFQLIVSTVSKVENAKMLFDLFDGSDEEQDSVSVSEDVETNDLLVRVSK